MGALLLAALAVLYRLAPDRDDARWAWVSPGAILATVLWLVGSILFSIYTANFGKYNETYGSLGAVVIVMLWLMLTAFAVIVGAELNAEVERQTRRDTTKGRPQQMGGRGAYAADWVGPTAELVEDGGDRSDVGSARTDGQDAG
jgi:membrane protein